MLGLGLALDLVRPPLGFTPAALFSAGEAGAFYDVSDLSSMSQDSAGTTPAAIGQPVGRILDRSGRGNHATQGTAGFRPILRADGGGRPYLEFDGVDDFLFTSSINFTATDKMTVVAGVRAIAPLLQPYVVMDVSASGNGAAGGASLYHTADEYRHGITSAGPLYEQAGIVNPMPSTDVVTCRWDYAAATLADALRMRIDGVDKAISFPLNSDATTGTFGNHPLFLGARGGGSLFFIGHLYGLIVRGAATTDLSPTESWMANKTGVTLG